ncbi:FG-GAP-like repeat-containing protein [Micromonospora sp. WMMD1120]|uniref:GDSL-type esterase/lipase family protein n=1 Tax=Micromonospora sp. WMMD1120 TaxID=3016106 RepID=UPI002417A062|nr:GDSL-type esterase/lipase family protein [Micromonospora sp. WMMD1120]MDG4809386.1 FG-GAP-like repeat-containing protein [Micromonospora sp. WMMD1120]
MLGLAPGRPALAAGLDPCDRGESAFTLPSGTSAGDVTLRLGCAKDAGDLRTLADSGDDAMFQITGHGAEYQDEFHDYMQKLTDESRRAKASGTSLGTFLGDRFTLNLPGVVPPTGEPAAPTLDFDGKLVTVDATLVVVIPAGEVQANANWWQKAVAAIGGTAIGALIGAACAAAIPVIPALAPACGALGGFFISLFIDLFNSMFDGRSLGSRDVWVEAITQGLLGAALGAAVGAVLAWAEKYGVPVFTSLQNYLKDSFRALLTWLGTKSGTLSVFAFIEEEMQRFLFDFVARLRRAVGQASTELRVMPLGDSITAGVESSDNNGYRGELFDALDIVAGDVDFVGSQEAGTMDDPDHEGHPGWRIDQITRVADCKVAQYKPNVITLMAGTNDINQSYDLSGAPQRLKNLINKALAYSPRATVVVAKLLPTDKSGLQPRIDTYNPAIYNVVRDLRAEGKHVIWADTSNIQASEGMQNDAHPNDGGYMKLAHAFYFGVREAMDGGWIQTPEMPEPSEPCDATGNPVDDGTALGSGWSRIGVIAPGMPRPANYVRTEIAEMNGDRRQDYVQIRQDGSIRVAINTEDEPGHITWPLWLGGTGVFNPCSTCAQVGTGSNPPAYGNQIRLADIDGNGRDDVVFVSEDGNMDAYLNLSVTNTSPPGWTKMANAGPAQLQGVKRAHIRFADINGDGRDDALRIGDNGRVHAYYNIADGDSGTLIKKPKWVEKLSWAPGVNGASLNSLRFSDVDGDGRADYLMVGTDGSVHAFLNRGGKDAGGFEQHLNWSNASNYPREYIQFNDVTGDGKADYLVVYRQGAVRAWLNRGGNL